MTVYLWQTNRSDVGTMCECVEHQMQCSGRISKWYLLIKHAFTVFISLKL